MKEFWVRLKNTWQKSVAPIIGYGGVIGIMTGAIVYFFKFGAEFLLEKSDYLYGLAKANPQFIPVVIVVLAALAIGVYFFRKLAKDLNHANVPAVEAIMLGKLPAKGILNAFACIFASYASFFVGLPLGSEGPSMVIGSGIGESIYLRVPNKDDKWHNLAITAGGAAGFAVAALSPLAAIVLIVEEVHKKISPDMILLSIMAVLSATLTSNGLAYAFNSYPILFDFGIIPVPTFNWLWLFIVLGVIVGFGAVLFNGVYFKILKLVKNSKIPALVRIILAFVITGLVAMYITEVSGGGLKLINAVAQNKLSWYILIGVFLLRIILMPLTLGSGAVGGTFIPTLAIGALLGGLCAKLFLLAGMPENYVTLIVFVALSAFLGGSLGAPITASVFMLEATGDFVMISYAGFTTLIACLIMRLSGVGFLYDTLMEKTIEESMKKQSASQIDVLDS